MAEQTAHIIVLLGIDEELDEALNSFFKDTDEKSETVVGRFPNYALEVASDYAVDVIFERSGKAAREGRPTPTCYQFVEFGWEFHETPDPIENILPIIGARKGALVICRAQEMSILKERLVERVAEVVAIDTRDVPWYSKSGTPSRESPSTSGGGELP
jgi:hypothetical protein